jgi:hypothetical protein
MARDHGLSGVLIRVLSCSSTAPFPAFKCGATRRANTAAQQRPQQRQSYYVCAGQRSRSESACGV